MRFWSRAGTHEDVVRALAERRFADLPRQVPSPTARREQLFAEMDAALSHLRAVHASYWDRDWRRSSRVRPVSRERAMGSRRRLPRPARRGRIPARRDRRVADCKRQPCHPFATNSRLHGMNTCVLCRAGWVGPEDGTGCVVSLAADRRGLSVRSADYGGPHAHGEERSWQGIE